MCENNIQATHTFLSNEIIKSGRSLSVTGRVNWEACLDEAKLDLYIFVASITVFIRACNREILK